MPDARAPHQGAIAVDVDDTLNDFSATLHGREFVHEPGYNLSMDKFEKYLGMIRGGVAEPGQFLSTEFTYFRHRIYMECFESANPRAGAVEFMQWLRAERWHIVILTHRDLRRANEVTRQWLRRFDIPFDSLFMAPNKIEFCRAWGIKHLVDDHLVNFLHWKPDCGVELFYPMLAKHEKLSNQIGRGFRQFSELQEWLCG